MSSTALAEYARRHRVHYEVAPEVVVTDQGRTSVGFEVRLFAVADKAANALPGSPVVEELAHELRAIAEAVAAEKDQPALVHIEEFDDHTVYDSHVVPGADEVALAVRVLHRDRYDQPIDEPEQRCLKAIRARLKELGVPER